MAFGEEPVYQQTHRARRFALNKPARRARWVDRYFFAGATNVWIIFVLTPLYTRTRHCAAATLSRRRNSSSSDERPRFAAKPQAAIYFPFNSAGNA
jgi:hypothetical protein